MAYYLCIALWARQRATSPECNFPNSAQKEEEERRPQDLSGVCREGEVGGRQYILDLA
jgi:hypothetical protein